jgi:acetyl esterase/lipase
MAEGFPNLFMVTGPGSPSVLSNMLVSIEQHVDWITDCIRDLRDSTYDTIEPTKKAVDGWVRHNNECAGITLMPQANSWYMGANVPGKTRIFLPYAGGVDRYRKACDDVRAKGYLGFVRRGPKGNMVNDGVIRELQPDIAIMLDIMGTLGLPPMESMSPADARTFSAAMSAVRPTGPEVGEIVDGTFPGPRGSLDYRLYRPASPGPHPILLYFHGGGWVLGDATSDDPFCRDLCDRSNAIIISANYGHGPEERFPAAIDDALAALRWAADNAAALGGVPGKLAVGGWSAGANLAAVVAQLARDNGGPELSGQMLITPVTDGSKPYRSHTENGEGYILTDALMKWFWSNYATEEQRHDPKASPLLANTLAGLPPALVVTCQFDPLRDEGDAYAAAMAAAGVRVRHLKANGHTHTSLTSVGMVFSGAPVRAEIAAALRGLFGAKVSV